MKISFYTIVFLLALASCKSKKPLFDPKDYAQPIPVMEGGIDGFTIVTPGMEPFEEPECNHFFVKQAFEVQPGDVDYLYVTLDQDNREISSSCICIYCHKKSKCY